MSCLKECSGIIKPRTFYTFFTLEVFNWLVGLLSMAFFQVLLELKRLHGAVVEAFETEHALRKINSVFRQTGEAILNATFFILAFLNSRRNVLRMTRDHIQQVKQRRLIKMNKKIRLSSSEP